MSNDSAEKPTPSFAGSGTKADIQASVSTAMEALELEGAEYQYDQHSYSADFGRSTGEDQRIGPGPVLEYVYGILGLLLGFWSILGGLVLVLHGAAGSLSWTATIFGAKSDLNDAVPGVVLFIVGLFVIWVTKPVVHLKYRGVPEKGKRQTGRPKAPRREPPNPGASSGRLTPHA